MLIKLDQTKQNSQSLIQPNQSDLSLTNLSDLAPQIYFNFQRLEEPNMKTNQFLLIFCLSFIIFYFGI